MRSGGGSPAGVSELAGRFVVPSCRRRMRTRPLARRHRNGDVVRLEERRLAGAGGGDAKIRQPDPQRGEVVIKPRGLEPDGVAFLDPAERVLQDARANDRRVQEKDEREQAGGDAEPDDREAAHQAVIVRRGSSTSQPQAMPSCRMRLASAAANREASSAVAPLARSPSRSAVSVSFRAVS
jgi:hypothetical protein